MNLMEFPFPELEEQLWEMKGKWELGFWGAKKGSFRKTAKILKPSAEYTDSPGSSGWGNTREVVGGKDPGNSRVAQRLAGTV